MKKLFPLMFAMTLTACSEPTPVASTEQINQLSQLDIYKTATKELVALIKSAKQDSEVELHAKTLVDISKVIIDDFIVGRRACATFLETVRQSGNFMPFSHVLIQIDILCDSHRFIICTSTDKKKEQCSPWFI